MAKFVGTLRIVIDTQRDDVRAAEWAMRELESFARRFFAVVEVSTTLEEKQV